MQPTLKAVKHDKVQGSEGLNEMTFTALYDNYSAALFSALYRMLKNTTLSEDALQNTFIKIWVNRNSYDAGKASLFTWMLNIACNEALELLHSNSHVQTRLAIHPDNYEFIADLNSLLQLNNEDLYKIISLLKPIDRNVLELCLLRGFTCEEAAELLHISNDRVKTLMRCSYKKLKVLLVKSNTKG